MPLLHIVIVLIIIGFLLWLVNRFIPMASSIKTILNVVVVIAVIIWLLTIFGVNLNLGNLGASGNSGSTGNAEHTKSH